MKKLIYTFIASSMLAATVTSCVDLDQEPKSFITEEEYIEYPKDVESVAKGVSGLYNQLRGTNAAGKHDNYGFNTRLQRLNVSADDVTYSPTKANNPLGTLESLTPSLYGNNDDFQTPWSIFYKVINNSNKIIEGTPITENNKVALQQIVGEAYFLRGLSYFYLVRLFGDVPLVLTKDDPDITMSRTSVAEIYEKAIIPSLSTAAQWLPEKSRSNDSSTPSKWAAKAALADAYMTMAGWPLKKGQEYYGKAETELNEIITKAGLELTKKYEDLWKEDKKTETNEHMFAIHHSVKFNTASNYGKSYYPADFYPKAGWSDYYASEKFYLSYPDDERKAWNFMVEWPVAENKIANYKDSKDGLPAISKYYDYDQGAPGNSAQANGITCIYRYADVLLMYAEASTRANGNVSSDAVAAIQKVQERAGYAQTNYTTTTNVEEFLNAVFNERGWEFFAEMKRWFDLVRLEKVADVKPTEWNGSTFKANNHYYFPIPYNEINLTGWANNAGY